MVGAALPLLEILPFGFDSPLALWVLDEEQDSGQVGLDDSDRLAIEKSEPPPTDFASDFTEYEPGISEFSSQVSEKNSGSMKM